MASPPDHLRALGPYPPSGTSTTRRASAHPQERSRNAVAQARHRAKRKAYIEQLEETVARLQQALGTPEGHGYHGTLPVDAEGLHGPHLGPEHGTSYPQLTNGEAHGRDVARLRDLTLENERLWHWVEQAKAILDHHNIPSPPIPHPETGPTLSCDANDMAAARRRSGSESSSHRLGRNGAFEATAVSESVIGPPHGDIDIAAGSSHVPRHSIPIPVSSFGEGGGSSDTASAHAPGLSLSSRQLPPLPGERPHFNFGARNSYGSRGAQESHIPPQHDPNSWTPSEAPTPFSQPYLSQSRVQADYAQEQANNHLNRVPSRMSNGHSGLGFEGRDRRMDSQPSTPVSLASMPPPHPQSSPTSLNIGGNGLHIPPPIPRANETTFHPSMVQGQVSSRSSNSNGPIVTEARVYGSFSRGGCERRIEQGNSQFKTEEVSGDVLARNNIPRTPHMSAVGMHPQSLAANAQSPVLAPAVAARQQPYPYPNHNGTNVPIGRNGQSNTYGSTHASGSHSPYTPTSAGSESMASVARSHGVDSSFNYPWSNPGYGR